MSDHRSAALLEIDRRLRKLYAVEFSLRSVDDQDWDFLLGQLGDGGRGRFWKAVVGELRAALKTVNGP
jgi:hypothetical protein